MDETTQPAVAGPVEPTVRPGLPVTGCVWGGMVWLVSLRSPKKLDLGERLYSEAELDAAVEQANARQNAAWRLMAEKMVAAERERTRQAISDRLADTVMSKYASKAECEAARAALRNAMLDVWGA